METVSFTRPRTIGIVACLGAVLVWAMPLAAQDKAKAIDALLTTYHDLGVFNGSALVSENGKVIFKKGFGYADFEWKIPNAPDTKFRLGSITKQFTSALVMQLVDEGKLSLEAPLASVLPYYRKDIGGRITIHHLLAHTSGIPSYTNLPNWEKEISRNPFGPREFVEKYGSGDLEFEPGTKFAYSNSGYFILGAIAEQVTGKTYDQLLQERIFGPLGMKASGYDLSRPILEKRARGYEQTMSGVRNADYLDMSQPYAAGSLYSTVEDLYLWDRALDGDKLLPAKTKERMFTPVLQNYGYGWTIAKRPVGPAKAERVMIAHGGGIYGFNTLISRVPQDDHLVVLLNNTGGTSLGAMSEGVMDILYGRTAPPAKRPLARALHETILKSGIAAAVQQYREIKKSRASDYDLGLIQLLRLGNELLAQKRNADAVEIFKLNVEAFPAVAPLHLMLADAYSEAGETALAINTYEKTLEVDPGNRTATEKLSQMLKR